MLNMEERVSKIERRYFFPGLSQRERACFEAGIALGSMFHQFIGMPVCSDEQFLKRVESMIEMSAMLQPYRSSVKVKINKEKIKEEESAYGYATLNEKDVELSVQIKYCNTKVKARMKYVKSLNYPLMYVEKVESAT
jgi:hypothetical protein